METMSAMGGKNGWMDGHGEEDKASQGSDHGKLGKGRERCVAFVERKERSRADQKEEKQVSRMSKSH